MLAQDKAGRPQYMIYNHGTEACSVERHYQNSGNGRRASKETGVTVVRPSPPGRYVGPLLDVVRDDQQRRGGIEEAVAVVRNPLGAPHAGFYGHLGVVIST